jgi:TonB family protein
MLAFLTYCLKVLVCSGVMYGYYLLALKNNRFHQWNRWYLLASVVMPFVLPILQITLPFANDNPLVYGNTILRGGEQSIIIRASHKTYLLSYVSLAAYAVACTALLVFFFRSLYRIRQMKRNNPVQQWGNIRFYQTSDPGTPFSFFHNIFWNVSLQPDSTKGSQILQHELTHVRQWHSVDNVAIQLLSCLCWWNPFLYFIKKELSVVHEFIADQQASADSGAKLQYASLLLTNVLGSSNMGLVHPFFHSPIKRRILMLTNHQQPRFSYIRRVVALPVAFILLAVFSFQCQRPAEDKELFAKSESSKETKNELPANALYVVDGKRSTAEEMKKLDASQIESVNVLKGQLAINSYGDAGKDGVVIITTKAVTTPVVSDVDQPALFPGGLAGWRRYLERNLKYPEAASDKGVQGTVRIELTVNKDGSLSQSKIKALNDPGAGLAEEAIRLISKGPKWKPATKNGQPVAYRFVQTITFQLE